MRTRAKSRALPDGNRARREYAPRRLLFLYDGKDPTGTGSIDTFQEIWRESFLPDPSAARISRPTTTSMVTKEAVPPIRLEMGSAAKTPLTAGVKNRGSHSVRGMTMKAFLSSEKKIACFDFSHSGEGALAGKLQRHEEKSEEIDLHGGDSRLNESGFIAENPDEKYGEQMQDPPDQSSIPDTDCGHEGDGLLDARELSGPVVETDDRLGAVGNACDGHGDDFPHRIDDSHHADVQVAAVPGKGSIANDLDGAVGWRT